MARSDKRYSVYPAPKAIEVLGATSPALNQALECWAVQLTIAMAENGKTFFNREPVDLDPLHECISHARSLKEWCVLAEALKDKTFDPDFASPGYLLAAAVEDAHRFENVGHKWFGAFEVIPDKDLDHHRTRCLEELLEKLRKLDYAHAWAVILAVQWYWEHHEQIDIEKDEWWTLAFRREWTAKQQKRAKQAQSSSRSKRRPR